MGNTVGTPVRRAMSALLLAGAMTVVLPAIASATRVVEVGGTSPRGTAAAVTVPGRSPRRARGASASSLRVLDASDAENRTNGKILGVDPKEGSYTCSGTAINTPSKSMVLTAGHCVVLEGVTASRISFVPAYDHGIRPFGTFDVSTVYVMPAWRHGENPDFDVAALKVEPNHLGDLTDVVGARGFAASRSRSADFEIYGYPAAALKGEEMRSCTSHGLGSDPLTFLFIGPPTIPGPCDMAAGSSGGAWLTEGDYVNGVTSYGYANRPDLLYSPYFGAGIGAFLKALP
jgi:V8-like Glu-specific endopeptidase